MQVIKAAICSQKRRSGDSYQSSSHPIVIIVSRRQTVLTGLRKTKLCSAYACQVPAAHSKVSIEQV